MCFHRKISLGRYNATRDEWRRAYRAARITNREGIDPDPVNSGITWKAQLIVAYERGNHVDPLSTSVLARLNERRMIDEILSEES